MPTGLTGGPAQKRARATLKADKRARRHVACSSVGYRTGEGTGAHGNGPSSWCIVAK